MVVLVEEVDVPLQVELHNWLVEEGEEEVLVADSLDRAVEQQRLEVHRTPVVASQVAYLVPM